MIVVLGFEDFIFALVGSSLCPGSFGGNATVFENYPVVRHQIEEEKYYSNFSGDEGVDTIRGISLLKYRLIMCEISFFPKITKVDDCLFCMVGEYFIE